MKTRRGRDAGNVKVPSRSPLNTMNTIMRTLRNADQPAFFENSSNDELDVTKIQKAVTQVVRRKSREPSRIDTSSEFQARSPGRGQMRHKIADNIAQIRRRQGIKISFFRVGLGRPHRAKERTGYLSPPSNETSAGPRRRVNTFAVPRRTACLIKWFGSKVTWYPFQECSTPSQEISLYSHPIALPTPQRLRTAAPPAAGSGTSSCRSGCWRGPG